VEVEDHGTLPVPTTEGNSAAYLIYKYLVKTAPRNTLLFNY